MPSNFGWFIIKILYTQHVDITLILIQMWLCVAFTVLKAHTSANIHTPSLSSYMDKHNWQQREEKKRETSSAARSRFAHNSCFFLLCMVFAYACVCIRRVWKSHWFTLWMCWMCECEKMNGTYFCATWTDVRWMDIWSRLRIWDWLCVCVCGRKNICMEHAVMRWIQSHFFLVWHLPRIYQFILSASVCGMCVCCISLCVLGSYRYKCCLEILKYSLW